MNIVLMRERAQQCTASKHFYHEYLEAAAKFRSGCWSSNTFKQKIMPSAQLNDSIRGVDINDPKHVAWLRLIVDHYQEETSLTWEALHAYKGTPSKLGASTQETREIFAPAVQPEQGTKDMTIKIENLTLINGTNITEIGDEALFGLIAKAEKDIDRLAGIDHKPQKLIKLINTKREEIKNLIALIDKDES